jgi:hypothetical protein
MDQTECRQSVQDNIWTQEGGVSEKFRILHNKGPRDLYRKWTEVPYL